MFCVYTEKKDRNPAKVLDLEKWRFYVVPTTVIREKLWHQKTVAESTIESLVGKPICYSRLSLRFNPVSGEECGKLPASA